MPIREDWKMEERLLSALYPVCYVLHYTTFPCTMDQLAPACTCLHLHCTSLGDHSTKRRSLSRTADRLIQTYLIYQVHQSDQVPTLPHTPQTLKEPWFGLFLACSMRCILHPALCNTDRQECLSFDAEKLEENSPWWDKGFCKQFLIPLPPSFVRDLSSSSTKAVHMTSLLDWDDYSFASSHRCE